MHQDLVHFVRLTLEQKTPEATSVGRRLLRQVIKDRPDLAGTVEPLLVDLQKGGLHRAARPRDAAPIPVDLDSRRELLRRYEPGQVDPVTWPDQVQRALNRLVHERLRASELLAGGVLPSRSALFVGPPGVGKTYAAHQVASRLGKELYVLDLASVMSSFLGRTGNNVRTVLDYAARSGGVLLLDEFDAVAKRRDDPADIGELRRLVNVLLQAIDDWPPDGLLFAATNHAELLDPAVWRRFDMIVEFPRPDPSAIRMALGHLLEERPSDASADLIVKMLEGCSYSEIQRHILGARRNAILENLPLMSALTLALEERVRALSVEERLKVAKSLSSLGLSQRRLHEATGLSRDTMRKHGVQGGGQNGS